MTQYFIFLKPFSKNVRFLKPFHNEEPYQDSPAKANLSTDDLIILSFQWNIF